MHNINNDNKGKQNRTNSLTEEGEVKMSCLSCFVVQTQKRVLIDIHPLLHIPPDLRKALFWSHGAVLLHKLTIKARVTR